MGQVSYLLLFTQLKHEESADFSGKSRATEVPCIFWWSRSWFRASSGDESKSHSNPARIWGVKPSQKTMKVCNVEDPISSWRHTLSSPKLLVHPPYMFGPKNLSRFPMEHSSESFWPSLTHDGDSYIWPLQWELEMLGKSAWITVFLIHWEQWPTVIHWESIWLDLDSG